jgi:ArsR family transcriptional regulator, virulence genes transcriptional regulator
MDRSPRLGTNRIMPSASDLPSCVGEPSPLASVDAAALSDAAEQASDFLKSLANPVRLRILCLLAQGESPVGDIAEKLSARQSLISQHLALLRKDGLVRPRRDGQTIRYALADQKAERLIGVLYESFCPVKTD